MTLAEYLASTKTRQTDYAHRLDVSVSRISRLVSRTMHPSYELALKIVEDTGGAVSFEELAALPTSAPELADSQSASLGA